MNDIVGKYKVYFYIVLSLLDLVLLSSYNTLATFSFCLVMEMEIWTIGGSAGAKGQGVEGGIISGGHYALIEQLCMTRTNIPTFFSLSLFSFYIYTQLLCLHAFGRGWHAEMKAADTTNAWIGCFLF